MNRAYSTAIPSLWVRCSGSRRFPLAAAASSSRRLKPGFTLLGTHTRRHPHTQRGAIGATVRSPPPGDFRLCESAASAVLAGLRRTAPLHHHLSRGYNNRSNDTLNCCCSSIYSAAAVSSSPLSPSLPYPASSSQRRLFSSSTVMGALKLDGTAIAKAIRERLGAEIAEKQRLNPRYKPSLKIIQGICPSHHCHYHSQVTQANVFSVGDRSDSCW